MVNVVHGTSTDFVLFVWSDGMGTSTIRGSMLLLLW